MIITAYYQDYRMETDFSMKISAQCSIVMKK